MKRQALENEIMEKRRLNFYGSELAKALKDHIMQKEQEKKIKQKWSKKWLKFLIMEKICKEITVKIQIEKEKREARKKMAAHIAAFKTATKIKLRLKGSSLNDRIINEARMSFQNLALFFRPFAKRDATICITKFLTKTKPIYFLHKSFMNLVNTSQRVQRSWRAFKKKKNEFRVALNDFWERYYLQVYNDPANIALFESSTTKLHGEELKNDEIAKRKFMQEIFVSCVKKYIMNYNFTRLDWLNQSPEDKKKSYVTRKWMAVNQRRMELEKIQQMQQQGIKPQTLKKSKKSMFEEPQDNDPESPKKLSNLRLFVLPSMAELLDLLKNAIIAQKTAKYL